MANKRKLYAFVFCIIGVSFYNLEHVFFLNENKILYFSIVGLSFSFAGLGLYVSGIKNRVQKKIRLCPKCFLKNEVSNLLCIKCSTPLI